MKGIYLFGCLTGVDGMLRHLSRRVSSAVKTGVARPAFSTLTTPSTPKLFELQRQLSFLQYEVDALLSIEKDMHRVGDNKGLDNMRKRIGDMFDLMMLVEKAKKKDDEYFNRMGYHPPEGSEPLFGGRGGFEGHTGGEEFQSWVDSLKRRLRSVECDYEKAILELDIVRYGEKAKIVEKIDNEHANDYCREYILNSFGLIDARFHRLKAELDLQDTLYRSPDSMDLLDQKRIALQKAREEEEVYADFLRVIQLNGQGNDFTCLIRKNLFPPDERN